VFRYDSSNRGQRVSLFEAPYETFNSMWLILPLVVKGNWTGPQSYRRGEGTSTRKIRSERDLSR
jgi:hypothetical protein